MIASETNKYKIFFIKDERGNVSYHYAETKDLAIKAHIEHWGIPGLRTEPRIAEIARPTAVICLDQACVSTAGIPAYAVQTLRNQQG
jgi:hypothetical protein